MQYAWGPAEGRGGVVDHWLLCLTVAYSTCLSGGGALQVQPAGQAGPDGVLPHRWRGGPRHLCGGGKSLLILTSAVNFSNFGLFQMQKSAWNIYYRNNNWTKMLKKHFIRESTNKNFEEEYWWWRTQNSCSWLHSDIARFWKCICFSS